MKSVAAILLCAGESTRMGQLKALLPVGNKILLQYQIDALLEANVTEVVVVLGHAAEKIGPVIEDNRRVIVVNNREHILGKTSSIKMGLQNLRHSVTDLILTAVDQPRPVHVLSFLIEKHLANPGLLSYPCYQGKRGHPLIFNHLLIPELLDIEEANLGVRAIVEKHSRPNSCVEIDSSIVGLDLNTVEDYEQIVQFDL